MNRRPPFDIARLSGPRAAVLAVLLAVLAGALGAFAVPVLDRDEGRYVQATAQMLETGDFVRINFMDEARNKKPAGIHWLQAASVATFSDVAARQVWAYRLPSLLGAGLAVLGCLLIGRRLLGPPAALAGALMLGTCVLLGLEAGIAKTDAMLCGAIALMMAALARLRFPPPGAGGRGAALCFWAALAAGVLVKGPMAPLVAGLFLATLLAWERDRAWARPLAWWAGPVLFVAIAAPWFVAVELAGAGFLREAFSVDLAPKLTGASEGHSGPPGYHTLALLLQFWPATLFLIPGLVLAWRAARAGRDDAAAAALRFLIAWSVPFLILLELAPTKLPHYALPAYPAFALIAGAGFAALLDGARMQRARIGSMALFGLGAAVWIAAALTLAALYGAPGALGFAVLTALVCGGLALGALAFSARRRPGGALVLAVLAAFGWHVLARGMVAPLIEPFGLSQRVAAQVPAEDRPLVVADYREPSLVFLLGGQVNFVLPEDLPDAAERGEGAAYAVSRDAAPEVEAALERAGMCAERLGEAGGLNYSNGRTLDLVVLAPRRACSPPAQGAES